LDGHRPRISRRVTRSRSSDDDRCRTTAARGRSGGAGERRFVLGRRDFLPGGRKFANTTTESCTRNPDGTLSCVEDHPDGVEWCINAATVDKDGVFYASSEDGNLYAIAQGGVEKQRIFLELALGAAYTPLSIGPDGKIYTQNAGHLFVIGE
jgi:hypothetical protein